MSTENYYSERYTFDLTLISLIPKGKKIHVKLINGNSDADCSSYILSLSQMFMQRVGSCCDFGYVENFEGKKCLGRTVET